MDHHLLRPTRGPGRWCRAGPLESLFCPVNSPSPRRVPTSRGRTGARTGVRITPDDQAVRATPHRPGRGPTRRPLPPRAAPSRPVPPRAAPSRPTPRRTALPRAPCGRPPRRTTPPAQPPRAPAALRTTRPPRAASPHRPRRPGEAHPPPATRHPRRPGEAHPPSRHPPRPPRRGSPVTPPLHRPATPPPRHSTTRPGGPRQGGSPARRPRPQAVHHEVQQPAGPRLPVTVRIELPEPGDGEEEVVGVRPGGWCPPPRWRAAGARRRRGRACWRAAPGRRAHWWPGGWRPRDRPWSWRTGRGGPSTRAAPAPAPGPPAARPRSRRPAASRAGRSPGRAPRGWEVPVERALPDARLLRDRAQRDVRATGQLGHGHGEDPLPVALRVAAQRHVPLRLPHASSRRVTAEKTALLTGQLSVKFLMSGQLSGCHHHSGGRGRCARPRAPNPRCRARPRACLAPSHPRTTTTRTTRTTRTARRPHVQRTARTRPLPSAFHDWPPDAEEG